MIGGALNSVIENKAYSFGCAAIFSKPFEMGQLLSILRSNQ